MQMLSNQVLINSTSIPLLLQWWQRRKRLANNATNSTPIFCDTDETYLEAYHRMMEIYSVVKAGGVQAQLNAAEAYLQRESVALQTALQTLQKNQSQSASKTSQEHQRLAQELQELERSVNWRITTLKAIKPEEEKAVSQHLREIEHILMQPRSFS